MGFADYLRLQIDLGYEEGKEGKEYTGKTFHGYYAFLSGKNNERKPGIIGNLRHTEVPHLNEKEV